MRRMAIGIATLLLAATGSAQAPAPFLIFFDWAKPDPTRDAAAVLDAVAAAYRDDPRALRLAGHSDRSGGEAVNRRSSRQRAETVRAALVERGIPRDRISVDAYGERQLIVATADGVREAQNRRVEISFAR
ncbi:MAG: OmpA family protein [Pseudomonadota bacterium]|nr:OmpA family protein [Pseudomonadota bacterium]